MVTTVKAHNCTVCNGSLLRAVRTYSDVRRVDVSRVVLLGGHQLHPGAVVRQHVLEAVLVRALGLLGHRALSRRVPPRDALVLLQQLPALQVLLQQLALRGRGGG